MRILIACSSGIHLDQALALRPWWERHERIWVTPATDHARAGLKGERVIEWTDGSLLRQARGASFARKVLREYRPDIVFSTGASVAVPFMAQSHAHGARNVFMESADRIDKPSATGRLVQPFVDEYLTQWETLAERMPRATAVGLVL